MTFRVTRLCLALCAVMCVISTTLAEEPERPGRVRLPSEGYSPMYEAVIAHAQSMHSMRPAWTAFRERNGDWRAMWSEWTGTPIRAWGVGIAIDGFASIHSGNADAAARRFISAHADLLRTSSISFELTDAHEYLDRWTVSYRQTFHGIPVELSEITLRMTKDGRVFLFGSDVFPELDVPTVPALGADDASIAALAGLAPPPPGSVHRTDGARLAILPIKSFTGVRTHLAWEVTVHDDEEHVWVTWVDAMNGEVLWRRNLVCEGITGQVTASVKANSVLQAESAVNIFDQHMVVGSATVTTDSSGTYASTGSGSTTARLRGPYARIERQDGTDAAVTQTVPNNGTFNVHWNSLNSTLAERTTFYNAMRSRDFIVRMDPSITAMNYQMACRVNVNNVCNANFDGNNLNFYRAGSSAQGPCANTGEMPDVIMHEYGHAVNSKVYIQFGKSSGMTNGALQEGMADANAAMILDRSEIGVGFFGVNTILRNTNNTNKYPDDITNQVHSDGLIIGGAMWDMRLSIGLARARQLSHFARHATPDDANTGRAFTKYFLEVLAADDNDGNLSNGTPNSSGIVPAFAKHGIPGGMLSIAHAAVSESPGGVPISLSANVTTALSSITTQSARIHYRIRGGSWTTATMQLTGGSQAATSTWTGSIPAQLNGTILEYYIEAFEVWGSSITYPAQGAAKPLRILVGFTSHTLFEFESAQGWQAGIPGDNATTGVWINAVPVGTSVNGTPVQPGQDNSPNGTKCWVTGNGPANGQPGDADVDGGKTTLQSPALRVAGLNTPVLRYYAWFSNDLGAAPGQDPWVVQISSNNGTNWTTLENTVVSFNSWSPRVFVIDEHITPSNQVLLRFVARDDDPGSLVEAAVDDVEILFVQQVPVELVAFSAARAGDRISTTWRTASEKNNAGFAIEYRMENSETWDHAGFVPARSVDGAGAEYRYEFDVRGTDAMFVRLMQMDYDGKTTSSPVVRVGSSAPDFRVHQNFPNPFNPSTTIAYDLTEAARVMLSIRDALGRSVMSIDLGERPAGAHTRMLDLGALPSGTYLYTIDADGRTASRVMHLSR